MKISHILVISMGLYTHQHHLVHCWIRVSLREGSLCLCPVSDFRATHFPCLDHGNRWDCGTDLGSNAQRPTSLLFLSKSSWWVVGGSDQEWYLSINCIIIIREKNNKDLTNKNDIDNNNICSHSHFLRACDALYLNLPNNLAWEILLPHLKWRNWVTEVEWLAQGHEITEGGQLCFNIILSKP